MFHLYVNSHYIRSKKTLKASYANFLFLSLYGKIGLRIHAQAFLFMGYSYSFDLQVVC